MRSNIFNALSLSGLLLAAAGCSNLPGTNTQQGAVIGGASGAAVGAAVGGSNHRVLGALLGGALGTAGGYVVGANSDKITGRDRNGADEAARRAQATPATPQQAMNAPTADLNNDGFVTLDEVVAMRQAGLNDQMIIDKLRATRQVFELTADQQQYLRSNGLSENVIQQMSQLNQNYIPQPTVQPAPIPQPQQEVIGRPAPR